MSKSILEAPDRNFWLCRADGGTYFEHFREHSIIALGHLDGIKNIDLNLERESNKEKIYRYLKSDLESNTRTNTNHLNQALHFIYDVKIGDLVLTVTNGWVLIGRIISESIFEKKPLHTMDERTEISLRMDQYLRRKVKWIANIPRHLLPYSLSRGMTGNQTFFSLNEYEDEIYSIVSPYVLKNGILTTNLQIKKQDSISTYHFSQLTDLFMKAEFIANSTEALRNVKSVEQIEELFIKYCKSGRIKSSIRAEFASPGWTSNFTPLKFASAAAIVVLAVSIALGGGAIKYKDDFNANTEGLFSKAERDHFAREFTDLTLQLLRQWLIKDSSDLKEHLALGKPGSEIDIKEFERK